MVDNEKVGGGQGKTPTIDEFVSRVTESRLVPAGRLQAMLDQLPVEQRTNRGSDRVQSLARGLVRHGLLTPYQARVICTHDPQRLVLGKYVILDQIGRGGAGTVFKVEHRGLKRLAALKVLTAKVGNGTSLHRFRREVKITARLDHPNIVGAYDADYSAGRLFLVMQYVDGQDLASLVRERGPLPVERAVNYILQAARGLEYAHRKGIIHRDIKPANLMLDRQGTVKVLDLGLARFAPPIAPRSGACLTQSGTIMGTVEYMAPEQADDAKRVDQRADVYSLGASLYFLLTGRPLYGGRSVVEKLMAHRDQPIPSLQQARPDVPAELEAVFRAMIMKCPADRLAMMDEVIAALENCLPDRSSTLSSEPAPGGSEDDRLCAFLQNLDHSSAAGTYTTPEGEKLARPGHQPHPAAGPPSGRGPRTMSWTVTRLPPSFSGRLAARLRLYQRTLCRWLG